MCLTTWNIIMVRKFLLGWLWVLRTIQRILVEKYFYAMWVWNMLDQNRAVSRMFFSTCTCHLFDIIWKQRVRPLGPLGPSEIITNFSQVMLKEEINPSIYLFLVPQVSSPFDICLSVYVVVGKCYMFVLFRKSTKKRTHCRLDQLT